MADAMVKHADETHGQFLSFPKLVPYVFLGLVYKFLIEVLATLILILPYYATNHLHTKKGK